MSNLRSAAQQAGYCNCEHWETCPACYPRGFHADGTRKTHEEMCPPDPAPAFAHRLALMLECALLDPNGSWDEAHKTLDEYRTAVQKWHEAHGERYVSAFGKD